MGQSPQREFQRILRHCGIRVAVVGQAIRALPSGELAKIKEISLFDQSLESAPEGKAVTLTLDREIDLSRGDVIASRDGPCEVAQQFEAELIWMDTEEGFAGTTVPLSVRHR